MSVRGVEVHLNELARWKQLERVRDRSRGLPLDAEDAPQTHILHVEGVGEDAK